MNGWLTALWTVGPLVTDEPPEYRAIRAELDEIYPDPSEHRCYAVITTEAGDEYLAQAEPEWCEAPDCPHCQEQS